jgi:hypothetical protein
MFFGPKRTTCIQEVIIIYKSSVAHCRRFLSPLTVACSQRVQLSDVKVQMCLIMKRTKEIQEGVVVTDTWVPTSSAL